MWTHFWDMHSGGGQKEDYAHIFIEAPQAEAEVIFYNRFGHNPHRVTCTCCGSDYSISEDESLKHITAYHRHCGTLEMKKGWSKLTAKEREFSNAHCYYEEGDEIPDCMVLKDAVGRFGKYITLEDYIKNGGSAFGRKEAACFIFAEDIKPEERVGEIPQQGYIWVD